LRAATIASADTPPSLVGCDLVGVAQRQADLVPSVQQSLLEEGVDLEPDRAAIGLGHGLLLQVDGELVPFVGPHLGEELLDDLR
jgi:hypothetical protein